MKKKIVLIVFVGLFVGIFQQVLSSAPAFARKYRMSCKTCHNPFPRLKPFGEEFAANGFVLEEQQAPRYFVKTGDEDLSLIRNLPLAFRIEGHMIYDNEGKDKFDFATPYLIKLVSGGTLAKNIAYYFYFFFSERGEVAGLEDAFLYFSDLFGSGISVAIGQFAVSDPLFKSELRLTYENYRIYKVKPGNSKIDLVYDRGVTISYGLKTGTDLTLEILNGNGIDEADFFKNFDSDKYKNVFGRISQDMGDNFRIGAFGYLGKEEQEGEVNSVWMAGVDGTFTSTNLELNIQYMEREDDNPFFLAGNTVDYRIKGGFAELLYFPRGDDSKWYSAALFNWIDYGGLRNEFQSLSFHLGLLLRRNVRLVGEVTYVFKDLNEKYTRFGLGLITAI